MIALKEFIEKYCIIKYNGNVIKSIKLSKSQIKFCNYLDKVNKHVTNKIEVDYERNKNEN